MTAQVSVLVVMTDLDLKSRLRNDSSAQKNWYLKYTHVHDKASFSEWVLLTMPH